MSLAPICKYTQAARRTHASVEIYDENENEEENKRKKKNKAAEMSVLAHEKKNLNEK